MTACFPGLGCRGVVVLDRTPQGAAAPMVAKQLTVLGLFYGQPREFHSVSVHGMVVVLSMWKASRNVYRLLRSPVRVCLRRLEAGYWFSSIMKFACLSSPILLELGENVARAALVPHRVRRLVPRDGIFLGQCSDRVLSLTVDITRPE